AAGAAGAKRAGGVDPRDAWTLLAKRSDSAGSGKARDRGKGKRGQVRPTAPLATPWLVCSTCRQYRPKPRLLLWFPGWPRRSRSPRPPWGTNDSGRTAEGTPQMSMKACEGCEEDKASGEDSVLAFVPSPLARNGPHHRVEAAFHCRTRRNISVEQRSLQELQIYYIPEREGMFHRGLGLNLTSGQYTAPVTGYYTFTATLHIAGEVRTPLMRLSCARNRLRVLICVQSLCQHDSSLETVSRLESSGDLFTVSVNGVLYLQAGQYASVFVDNIARSPLTVQSGSDFSAVLLGV
uniref:Erythroferrone n=1 Tax=Apteryx owenii TaxID=8824 RepID=A0A8B9P2H2_APTOW